MAANKSPSLESRVTTLEGQMSEVLAKPAFRKRTERGVCTLGFEPSENCPDGSLGRMQGGCHGFACLTKGQTYYKEYRQRKKAQAPATTTVKAVKVANPTKKTVKRAPAKAAAPPVKKQGAIKRRG